MVKTLVLDTESSTDRRDGARRLLAIAYCVTPVVTQADVEVSYIWHEDEATRDSLALDTQSHTIHGLDSRAPPEPRLTPRQALERLFAHVACLHQNTKRVAAHGVAGDMALLFAEAARCGLSLADFPPAMRTLYCTRTAARVPCAIPLPRDIAGRNRLLRSMGPAVAPLMGKGGAPLRDQAFKWPGLRQACAKLNVLPVRSDDRGQVHHDVREDVCMCALLLERLKDPAS